MGYRILTVSADHVAPDYRLSREPIHVVGPSICGKFYADHAKLGCGKDHDSPESAVRGILLDHGYRNITIHVD